MYFRFALTAFEAPSLKDDCHLNTSSVETAGHVADLSQARLVLCRDALHVSICWVLAVELV